jgi:hypothetical protein
MGGFQNLNEKDLEDASGASIDWKSPCKKG